MSQPDDDMGFWKWGVGVAIPALTWLIAKVWVSSGILATLKHTDQDHATRLDSHDKQLEALVLYCKEQVDFCDKRKNELLLELTKEVCNVVRLAIKDVTIEHNQKLAAIGTNQALQGQMLQQIQLDVEAIFGRMNQRVTDTSHPRGSVGRRLTDGPD